jgi:hypothetical protein
MPSKKLIHKNIIKTTISIERLNFAIAPIIKFEKRNAYINKLAKAVISGGKEHKKINISHILYKQLK